MSYYADNPLRTIVLPAYRGCSVINSGWEGLSKKEISTKQLPILTKRKQLVGVI